MEKYLEQHAAENVWCTPEMDRQAILKPARLTPRRGAIREVSIAWVHNIKLPNPTRRYHVYQIGQIPNAWLGIDMPLTEWICLGMLCTRENQFARVYVDEADEIPRCVCWLRRIDERNIVLAVDYEYGKKITDIDAFDIYLHLYSNSYYNSSRYVDEDEAIIAESHYVLSVESALPILNRFYALSSKPGFTTLTVDGVIVDYLAPADVVPGTIIEYIHDGSIDLVHTIKGVDLPTFTSTLDGKRKVLVHLPKDLANVGTIRYRDDIQLQLIRRVDEKRVKGFTMHMNREDTLRMITHRDYSVPVDYINAFINVHLNLMQPGNYELRLLCRKSGYQRPLVFETNRIHELYRLEDDEIVDAMLGINSTLDIWKAEHLEASAYPAIMRAPKPVTYTEVLDAYGYHALTKLVADMSYAVDRSSSVPSVKLRSAHQSKATIYEYDAVGLLIDYYPHTDGVNYYPKNQNCWHIEAIPGHGADTWAYAQSRLQAGERMLIEAGKHYRVYSRPVDNNGIAYGRWRDDTASTWLSLEDEVAITADLAADQAENGGQTRFDELITFYSTLYQDLPYEEIAEMATEDTSYPRMYYAIADGNWISKRYAICPTTDDLIVPISVPVEPRYVDIWMNGHALIRGLDFHYTDDGFMICNKQHIDDVLDDQDIVVRAHGLPIGVDKVQSSAEYGFVGGGVIGRNLRYDVRDDHIVRCLVGGRVLLKDSLAFIESADGQVRGDLEGLPYVIQHVSPHVSIVGIEDIDSMRIQAQEVNQMVSDYLSVKRPEEPMALPIATAAPWVLYSPFLSAVLADIVDGTVSIQQRVTDLQLDAIVSPYLHLLDGDPCTKGVAAGLVTIHPHEGTTEKTVNLAEYNFLERVAGRYLNNLVDLTKFITVEVTHVS